MARWPARRAPWRRRPDGPHPPARRHPSADGVQPCRPRIHRRPGTAGAARPQLRRPDTPRHLHRPRRLRHRTGPPARCSLRRGTDVLPTTRPSSASRSRTTPCSATPAALRWSARTGRSTGCASLASTVGRCSVASSAGRPQAASVLRPARPIGLASRRYRPETVTLETTWNTDAGPLTLTEGMVAEVSGHLLPSTMLVRRLTAEDGPVEAVIDVRPAPRGAAPAPRASSTETESWSAAGRPRPSRSGQPPPCTFEPGQSHTVTRHVPTDPFTSVLTVADREPLIYVDPDAAWDALQRDELRWRAWCRDIDPTTSPPRRGGSQPADPAPADLLPVGGAGCRAHHLAARGPRRNPELGLPLRLAPRRQHRHRCLPRRRQSTTRPAPSWPGCSAPPASTVHAYRSC